MPLRSRSLLLLALKLLVALLAAAFLLRARRAEAGPPQPNDLSLSTTASTS